MRHSRLSALSSDLALTSRSALLQGICWTYLRFHKSLRLQGVDRNTLAYKAPLQPYLTWYALIFVCIILFFNGWEVFAGYGSEGYKFDQATFVTCECSASSFWTFRSAR